MQIYFDGTLVNNEYYVGIKKSAKAYDGKLKLGATICKNYTITVDKQVIMVTPSVITIYENNVLKDTLKVTKIEDVDNFTSVIYAEDNMTLFNFQYNPSSLIQNNTISIADVLTDICTQAGVSLGFDPTELRLDKTFTYCASGLIARNYLQFIGEYNCVNFLINPSGELTYIDITDSPVQVNSEISQYKIGNSHYISKVSAQDGDLVFGDDDGETYYVNPDNILFQDRTDVMRLCYKLSDLNIYNDLKLNDFILIDDQYLGSFFEIEIDGNTYYGVYQYDNATYYQEENIGKWITNINVQLENKEEASTEIIGTPDNIREIKRVIDYQNGEISQTVRKDDVISSINQSAEQIDIDASKINLNGVVTANNNFKILSDGSMEAVNGKFINGNISIISDEYQTTPQNYKINIYNTTTLLNAKLYPDALIFSNNDSQTSNRTIITRNQILCANDDYINNVGKWAYMTPDWIRIVDKTNNKQATIMADNMNINNTVVLNGSNGTVEASSYVSTPHIYAGNIDCGFSSCSSSGYTQINFNKTFAYAPIVVCTPNTSTNGVIAVKIRNVTTTGFEATIGGTGFGNEVFNWIAILN